MKSSEKTKYFTVSKESIEVEIEKIVNGNAKSQNLILRLSKSPNLSFVGHIGDYTITIPIENNPNFYLRAENFQVPSDITKISKDRIIDAVGNYFDKVYGH